MPKITLTNKACWGTCLGTCHFWGTKMLFFRKKQLKMKKFPIKNLNFAQNPLWKFWVNFGHFWLKMTSQKAQIHQNWPLKKIFFRGHINILQPTKFRYWLSLQILNVYFMLEGPLNELCKRLRSIGICKFPHFSAYETFKGQNHLIN